MRIPIWKRLLFVAVSVGVIFMVAFTYFAKKYAEPLLEYQLSRIFAQPVSIGKIAIMPPAGIVVRDFKVPGLIEAPAIRFQFVWPNIFLREWFIRELRFERPTIYWERMNSKEAASPTTPVAQSSVAASVRSSPPASAENIFGKDWGVKISRLTIQGGQILYRDETNSLDVKVSRLYLTARTLAYPVRPERVNFVFRAEVEGEGMPFASSHTEGRGWLNWPQRDLEADIVLNTLDGKRILSAQAKAKNNQMMVQGRMKMSSQMFKPAAEVKKASVTDLFVVAAETAGIEVDTDFRFQTLLDQFEIGKVSISGNFGYSAQAGEKFKQLKEKVLNPPSNGLTAF